MGPWKGILHTLIATGIFSSEDLCPTGCLFLCTLISCTERNKRIHSRDTLQGAGAVCMPLIRPVMQGEAVDPLNLQFV